jgi:chloramphenicol-sensitive protein RarD
MLKGVRNLGVIGWVSVRSIRAMDPEVARGVRAAVVAYLLWGLLTVYWKQLTHFDAVELIGWRMVMAAAVMAVIVTVNGRWQVIVDSLRTPRLAARMLVAGLLLATNWTTYVWAVVNDHLLETALGYFLAPLGTMAVGVLVLHERLTPLRRLAMVFAIAAVAVLTISYGRLPFVAIIIAVSWTCYGVAKREVPLTPVESLAGETFLLTPAAIALIVVLGQRADSVPETAGAVDWLLVAGTGIATAVPLLLFAFAAKRVPFTVLGPLNYLVPLINFVLGWLVYDEALPPSRVAGFLLVWCALVAVTIDTVSAARRSRELAVVAV